MWKTLCKTTHETTASIGLLLLRLAAGGMMAAAHGWPKISGFAEKSVRFADPIGLGSEISLALAVFAEFFCSLLLMAGLFTRAAAVPLLTTMFVAAFIVHADDPFSKQEFALLYAVQFAALFIAGAGRFSVDSLISRKKFAQSEPPEY